MAAAILDPETVFQMSDAGVPLPQLLAARGILPGVKPSLKVYKLPGCDGETVMLRGREDRILSLVPHPKPESKPEPKPEPKPGVVVHGVDSLSLALALARARARSLTR